MQFVQTPNLPQSAVAVVAAASCAASVLAGLDRQGIEVVQTRPLAALPAPVADHADLQLLHLGHNQVLLTPPAAYLQPQLTKLGINCHFIDADVGNSYPDDISLNFLLQQNSCFGLCSKMPLQLQKHCKDAGLQPVNSKQGYARCSVAVVTDHAAMTADPTLHKLLTARGIDVLRLEPGGIVLEGYSTGFIGGCCGLIAPDKLAFSGTLERYPQQDRVVAFLNKHKVVPVYLSDCNLLDIGGILPLMTV